MSFNVFISYASADREWAERMAHALTGRGLKVFFDKASLRDGDGWEDQITAALKSSAHLVCFWSTSAHGSAWVQAELGAFRVGMTGDGRQDAKLFMIPLDAKQQNSFARIQQLDVPAVKAAYAADGVNAMSAQDWLALVDRIDHDVRTRSASMQVPVALLTLDTSFLPLSKRDLTRIQAELGLTEAEITQRYGARRLDWVPFTNGPTIESHLDDSRTEINAWLAKSPSTVNETMDWQLPDERFWSATDVDGVREFAGRMENGQPGLIIIDPIATLLADVQSRLSLFSRCLKLGNVAIVAPHPMPATAQDASFRRWVFNNTVSLLNDYVSPRPLPESPMFARFGIGVDHIDEMRRLLKTSIGDVLRSRHATIPVAAAIRN